jgi:hypothetical protein
VAQAFMGINLDNAALPGIYIGVVMGRHAGFLTAASALGKKFSDDGPHLIYMPERTFEIDQFIQDVKQVYDRLGRCIVAVSEGIHDASGEPIISKLSQEVERDAHGNVQLSGSGALADLLTQKVKDELQITRVRGDTLGYIQRSFVGCVSDVDQNEAREVGEKAVQYGMFGDRDGSVTIKRTGHYSVDYELVPLEAGCRKDPDHARRVHLGLRHDVTDAFRHVSAPASGLRHARRPSPAPEQGAEDPGGRRDRLSTFHSLLDVSVRRQRGNSGNQRAQTENVEGTGGRTFSQRSSPPRETEMCGDPLLDSPCRRLKRSFQGSANE